MNNVAQGQAYESYFGPPSELVNVAEFLSSVALLDAPSSSASSTELSELLDGIEEKWKMLSNDRQNQVDLECRYVADLPMTDVMSEYTFAASDLDMSPLS